MPDPNLDTLDYDFRLVDRYQAYSAELLRISLLAVGGLGILFRELLTREDSTGILRIPAGQYSRFALVISVLAFALSAAFAVVHRYTSTDSMALFIDFLRKSKTEDDRAEKIKEARDRMFKYSKWLIRLSFVSLIGGVSFFLIGVISIFFSNV